MLQKYAIMLLIFHDWLITILLLQHKPERSATFSRDSMLSSSALVLLKLSEPSSPESSTSSPSLETMVNLVPEAKATSTTIRLVAFGLSSHVQTAHAQCAMRMKLKK